MEKVFIIDGNSLINRAFYALPLLSNSEGEYSNAVFGFINCLIKLITENNPKYIVVAFDHARKTFRNEIYSEYKGTRKPTPVELVPQFGIVKKILTEMGIKCIEQEGIEADDIIGTISKLSNQKNYIITGDRDSLQLVSDNTTVWLTQKGISEIKEVNMSNITDLYGLTPSQIIEFKALAGDSSDNIPGISGIGEKTAINLLNTYKTVDGLYENLEQLKGKQKEKIEQGKQSCYMSKALATIKTDCEIDFHLSDCTYNFPLNNNVKKLFEKYSFNSLLKKETLFIPQKQNIIEINVEELNNLIKNYTDNKFIFKINKNFEFIVNNQAYSFKINDYNELFKILLPILENENILKIIQELKSIMHYFNYSKINNVFDLSLGEYLISGGAKNSIDICDFYNQYLYQKEQLKNLELENLYYNVELPLVSVLFDMEQEGFAIDKTTLIELQDAYGSEIAQLEFEIKSYTSNKEINIKSPKQVAEFLFGELKLPDKFNKKHSTNVDALEGLKDFHPVVGLIIRYRKVCKLFSTYIEPYLKIMNSCQDSLIHTIFNQTQTATGRLSSSEPNLQNIPVRDEEGRGIRKIFISRFNGGTIISADYNQIELRLLANFSLDEKLINDYNQGTDIHKLTASQIFEIPCEQVTDFQRRMAKAVNFGIIYGISSFGLAKNIDMPVKEAKKYIEVYFEKYPQVKRYLDSCVSFAKDKGYIKTLLGRFRYIPELKSNNGLQRVFGERVAMNMPLQGSASDIIKMAMINVHKRFKKENIKSKLILQIHDELIVDTYPNEEDLVSDILVEEMQNVYKGQVPLVVAVNRGKTLYDCK